MKTFSKFIAIFLSVLIIAGVAFVSGYYVGSNNPPEAEVVENSTDENDLHLPGEVEKRIVTVEEINSKLVEISEFSTYSSEYEVTKSADYSRYFLDKFRALFTKNSITLKAKGILKVGYDFFEIKTEVDPESNIIYIALPEIKVLDNYILWDTIECVEDNNFFNPIEFSQYKQLATEMEALGLADAEEKGIYENGEAHVQELIINFLSCFEGYEVKFL